VNFLLSTFRYAGRRIALAAAVLMIVIAVPRVGMNTAYAQDAAQNPAASSAGGAANHATSGTQGVSGTDRQFVQTASVAGATEIEAAKIAMHQSHDKAVKAFASRMITDHTRLAAQLARAIPHGVEAPQGADTAALDGIRSLQGADFDSAYISKFGIQGHKDAIAAFQDEAQNGQDASLKQTAQKALPTIQHHYVMAQALAKKKGVLASP
jgi:putative membrane protein